ncbi:MAG: SufE family protein [Verrucomicrobia bacterium]|nr:SufE family protein [Verrucomicrobiota bacterium]
MPDCQPFETCILKQQRIKQLFSCCSTPQQKYEKIIELGRLLSPYPVELKTPDRLVKGCQSEMYLSTSYTEGKVVFQAYSEALISAGLAALLLSVYSEEPPEAVLTCPPLFLEELGIHGSLSPSRSNGLSSLFLRMKQDSLNFLIALQSARR